MLNNNAAMPHGYLNFSVLSSFSASTESLLLFSSDSAKALAVPFSKYTVTMLIPTGPM